MRGSRILATLVLAGTLLVPIRADAQTYLTPDTWFRFSWSDLGTIAEQFTASTSTLRVVDCCIVGDMFEIFAGGSSVGTTSAVAAGDGTSTGAASGDAAWADGRLSMGMFTVSAGDLITIDVVQRTALAGSGAGFIQSASTVPEPATVLLLMSGLAGIAFVGVRRKKEDETEA